MSVHASVAGGMNLDVAGKSARALIDRDSNPGEIRFSPGGVGRNIAFQLARAGARVRLFTCVSRDSAGQMLRADCERNRIDLSFARVSDSPSSCYISIHDPSGDMALAVNDMALTNEITPEYLSGALAAMMDADVCALDANLPEESLRFLAARATVPLVADPVSCRKADRLKAILPRLYAIKPNLMEAEYFTGETGAEAAADALLKMGVKHVIISLGERGAYFADAGARGYLRAPALHACQTTGAGDAMCAGVALGAAAREGAEACARRGVSRSEALLGERDERG